MEKGELLAECKRMYGVLRQQDKREIQQLTKDEDFLNLQLELQAERDARNALEKRIQGMQTSTGVDPDTPESHAKLAQAVDRSMSQNLQEQTDKLTAEVASLREALQQAEDDQETAAEQAELTETSLKDEITRLEAEHRKFQEQQVSRDRSRTLGEVEANNLTMRKSIKKQKKQLAEQQKRISELEDTADTGRFASQASVIELNDIRQENSDLKEQIANLSMQLEDIQSARNEEVEEELEELRAKVEEKEKLLKRSYKNKVQFVRHVAKEMEKLRGVIKKLGAAQMAGTLKPKKSKRKQKGTKRKKWRNPDKRRVSITDTIDTFDDDLPAAF